MFGTSVCCGSVPQKCLAPQRAKVWYLRELWFCTSEVSGTSDSYSLVPQRVVALHHELSKVFVCSSLQSFSSLDGSFDLLDHMKRSLIGDIIHAILHL